MCVCVCVCVWVAWSYLTLCTPRTVAHQAPLSMGFSRQGYWSGLPCPPPGDPPNQGLKPGVPHCRRILYHLSHQGSPFSSIYHVKILEGLIFKVIKICVLIYLDNLKSYQYILLIYFTEMQMSKITALSLLISLKKVCLRNFSVRLRMIFNLMNHSGQRASLISSVGKESAYDAGHPGLIPGLGRSAGEGMGYPL